MRARVHTALSAVALTAVAMLGFTPRASADLAPQVLPAFGGPGGRSFSQGCSTAAVLTGIRVRRGTVIDAVGLLCRTVASDGQLGSEAASGTMVGGDGGTAASARCPAGSVVAGATVHSAAPLTPVVGVTLRCRNWVASTRRFGSTSTEVRVGVGAAFGGTAACSQAVQPARLIHGRSGLVVDALGFACDEP